MSELRFVKFTAVTDNAPIWINPNNVAAVWEVVGDVFEPGEDVGPQPIWTVISFDPVADISVSVMERLTTVINRLQGTGEDE